MPERYRLNFTLSVENLERLDHYKSQTARSRTEVIRQLVVDFVQGHLDRPATVEHPQHGARFDVFLSLGAQELLSASALNCSVSGLINGLLNEWLPPRLKPLPETVTVVTKVPVDLLQQLSELGDPAKQLVELASIALGKEGTHASA